MWKMSSIYLKKDCIERLLARGETYEVISGRAKTFMIGYDYVVCSDVGGCKYVRVVDNEKVRAYSVDDKVWDEIGATSASEYIKEHCGEGAWVLNSWVYVLRLKVVNRLDRVVEEKSNNMRKVNVHSQLSNGAFASMAMYEIGELVVVSEPYCYLCDRYGDEMRDKLCREYGVTRDELGTIKGWTNKRHTRAKFMPIKLRIVDCKSVRVSEISDNDWFLLGVSNDNARMKKRIVGNDYWQLDSVISIYRYEVIDGNIRDKVW